jgi:gas vesicle protein
MSDENDFGTFLAGFIIGGLVGAAVALITAPQSGEETRSVIHDKSIELKDKAVSTAEETRSRAEKALEEARQRADQALEEVRLRAEDLAEVTKERAMEIAQRGQVVLEQQMARLETARDVTGQTGAESGASSADAPEIPVV